MSELVQSVINYFSDWSRGEILQFVALLLGIIGGIVAIIKWYVRKVMHPPFDPSEISKRIRFYYTDYLPVVELAEGAKSNAKFLFYQGRSTRTALENVLLGFSAEREILLRILDRISKWDAKSPLHIEIVGDRKQGKSILLAQIAVRLKESGGYTLLIQHEGADDEAFDFELLKNYLRIRTPKWYGRILRGQKAQKLAVLIDDFVTYNEDAVTTIKSSFLHQILNSRLPILFVTSSHVEVGTVKSVKFELFLTPTDEERILSKLKEPPPLIPSSLTISSIRGSTGGYRIYKGELMAFLSLLVEKAAEESAIFIEGFKELDLELDDVGKDALKYIAACQLVDVELPIGILRYVVPEVNIDRLVSDAKGWVRLRPLSYSSDGRGLCLGAPYFACFVLGHFGISDMLTLEELFVNILKGLAKRGSYRESSYEREFVRHILYRLAKGRHFRFHGINGVLLAQSLYQKFSQVLIEFVNSTTDTRSLALWAATLARLRQQDLTKPICLQIIQQISRSSELLHGQAFVALALALNSLMDSDLRERGLSVLDLRELMQHCVPLPSEEETRRINEAIHVYCNLLKDLGRFEEALSVLENIPVTIRPDALTVCLKAKLMGILGNEQANETYVQAITLAEEAVRRSPEMMVECLFAYGDFLLRLLRWGVSAKHPRYSYAKAAEYMKYAPEKYQNVLSAWARSIFAESPQSSFKLYQESLEIDRQNQTVHVNSHLGLVQLLLDRPDLFYKRPENAYEEAERLCRKVLDYPYLEFREKARVYRVMGEHLIGKKTYIWEGKKQRPDFSEAEDLLLKAFESDPDRRNDDTYKTLTDALAHLSLANFYWHWSTKYPDQLNSSHLADKAIFHFQKAFSGLPRRDLDGLYVRLNVLNGLDDYIRVKRYRQESILREHVETLALLEKWHLARVWHRTWAFLSSCIDSLCEIDVSIFRKRFDEMYQQMERIVGTDPGSLSRLVMLTTNKLRRRAFALISIGQGNNAPEYLDKALNLVSQYLENNPKDTKVAQMVSKVVIGKLQKQIERNKDRIDKAVELMKRTVSLCPTNSGALESLLRVADVLPQDDQRLIKLETMLDQLLDRNDNAVHALQDVFRRFQEQGYWFDKGRLTKRLLRYMKYMEPVDSGTE